MSPDDANLRLVKLADVQREIVDADLLLFRSRGVIASAGRSVYSHAAKAAWWGDDLFCLEVREFKGGRGVTLLSQVQRFPGRIDVYEVNPDNRWPEYNRHNATHVMRQFAGCEYGWWNVLLLSLRHAPLVRWLVKPRLADDYAVLSGAAIRGNPPFCSQACATADRLGGGVDPVPELADRQTEPADLARSELYRYQFTLIP